MKNNTWAIGDCHGAFKALTQILERAPIKEGDTIIQLGDICDGWSEVYECVELFISMQEKYNMIFLKGNHDDWFNEYLKYGVHPVGFLQGGNGTWDSYNKHLGIGNVPQTHVEFFNKQHLYYVDDQKRLFVHGGFNRHYTLEENKKTPFLFYWDRDLWMSALSYKQLPEKEGKKSISFKIKEPLTEIFIGHTTTMNWKTDKPMQAANIWNLDTGAGFGSGKLTIMNIDTKEFWQSDPVNSLYVNEKGR